MTENYKTTALMLTFGSLLLLTLSDLLTTYVGVCMYGGVELQPFAINIAQRYGFLAVAGFQFFMYGMMSLVFYKILIKAEKDTIRRTIVIVLLIMAIFHYSEVVMYNVNGVLWVMTGKNFLPLDAPMKDVTVQQIQFIEENFDRGEFCRLL